MDDRIIHGYLDNHPVSFDFDKQEFTHKETGGKLANGKAILDRRQFEAGEVVFIGDAAYLKDAERREYVRYSNPNEQLAFDSLKGQRILVTRGEEFRFRMRKEVAEVVRQRLVPPQELRSIYLDNVSFMEDPERNTFWSSLNGGVILNVEDVQRLKLHVAHLQIVSVKGKGYYLDERLKQLRCVGNPGQFMSFDDYDELDAEGEGLSIPLGKVFRKLMEKERNRRDRMIGGRNGRWQQERMP